MDGIEEVRVRIGDGPLSEITVQALVRGKDDGVVRCKKCGAEMGRKVRRNGRVMIKIGNWVCYRVHGWCDVCDRQKHWEGQNGNKKHFAEGEKTNV